MSIELLELGAAALGGLVPEVAFLGGASIELWITDPAAPPVRPTKDVDVVVEVVTRSEFYTFEARLRAHGFSEDQEDGVICRWRHNATGLILDAMPGRPEILGFENRWHAAALSHAVERQLPLGDQDPGRKSPLPARHQTGRVQEPRARRPPWQP